MPSPPRHFRSLLRPEPWLAALVAVGMMVSGGSAGAAAIAAASASIVEDAHGEHCNCGPRCREAACCCGPTEAPSKPWKAFEPSEDAKAAPSAPHEPSGPCLGALPCGDPAAPVGSATSVEVKSAALVFQLGAPARESKRLDARFAAVRPPAPFPTRLERPPRIDATA